MAKYDTNRHEEALTQLSELLMEESLSPVYRLKANVALADGVDDWFLAEQYRLAAEYTYHGISEVVADNMTDDNEGRELAAELATSREVLDSLAEDQAREKPSQQEITEANDAERSISSTSQANESTTSPTDGHPPIAEGQGSQAEHAYPRGFEQGEPSAKSEGQPKR